MQIRKNNDYTDIILNQNDYISALPYELLCQIVQYLPDSSTLSLVQCNKSLTYNLSGLLSREVCAEKMAYLLLMCHGKSRISGYNRFSIKKAISEQFLGSEERPYYKYEEYQSREREFQNIYDSLKENPWHLDADIRERAIEKIKQMQIPISPSTLEKLNHFIVNILMFFKAHGTGNFKPLISYIFFMDLKSNINIFIGDTKVSYEQLVSKSDCELFDLFLLAILFNNEDILQYFSGEGPNLLDRLLDSKFKDHNGRYSLDFIFDRSQRLHKLYGNPESEEWKSILFCLAASGNVELFKEYKEKISSVDLGCHSERSHKELLNLAAMCSVEFLKELWFYEDEEYGCIEFPELITEETYASALIGNNLESCKFLLENISKDQVQVFKKVINNILEKGCMECRYFDDECLHTIKPLDKDGFYTNRIKLMLHTLGLLNEDHTLNDQIDLYGLTEAQLKPTQSYLK